MEEYLDRLEERWLNLWDRINAEGDGKKEFSELIYYYTRPERTYHNLDHIVAFLAEFDEVLDFDDPDKAEMAIWYHDVIYDSHLSDNEDKSAVLAEKRLAEANPYFVDGVIDLILATKHDKRPQYKDAQYIVDIDLVSLGLQPDEFQRNYDNIREEYNFVPTIVFNKGRSKLLQGFLKRDTIYYTDHFREKYESQAIENLKKSIKTLNA